MASFIPENGIILDFSDVAPSPCKDFCQIVINCKKKNVFFRNWKVTPRSRENLLAPQEIKNTYEDFFHDDRLHSEIHRVFGPHTLEYITKLVEGHIDYLPRLPDNVLVHILTFLELEDLPRMAQVSKKFHELCMGDALWQKIYRQNSEAGITEELTRLAEEVGWRKLFFTNKLQLQVQLRRQARKRSASSATKQKSMTTRSSGDTFLTEELE